MRLIMRKYGIDTSENYQISTLLGIQTNGTRYQNVRNGECQPCMRHKSYKLYIVMASPINN